MSTKHYSTLNGEDSSMEGPLRRNRSRAKENMADLSSEASKAEGPVERFDIVSSMQLRLLSGLLFWSMMILIPIFWENIEARNLSLSMEGAALFGGIFAALICGLATIFLLCTWLLSDKGIGVKIGAVPIWIDWSDICMLRIEKAPWTSIRVCRINRKGRPYSIHIPVGLFPAQRREVFAAILNSRLPAELQISVSESGKIGPLGFPIQAWFRQRVLLYFIFFLLAVVWFIGLYFLMRPGSPVYGWEWGANISIAYLCASAAIIPFCLGINRWVFREGRLYMSCKYEELGYLVSKPTQSMRGKCARPSEPSQYSGSTSPHLCDRKKERIRDGSARAVF